MFTGLHPAAPIGSPDFVVLALREDDVISPSAAVVLQCVITYADSTSPIPVYDVGDTIPMIATFRYTTGTLVDPEDLVFTMRLPGTPSPALVEYEYGVDDELARASTGVYRVNYPVTLVGKHYIQFSAESVSTDGQFTVRASMVQ